MGILLALRDGPRARTELYGMVSRNLRMPDKISDLKGIGLIAIMKTDRRADSIFLTEKGARVAGLIDMIDGTIGTSCGSTAESLEYPRKVAEGGRGPAPPVC